MAMLSVGTSAASLAPVPHDPYKMDWGLQDVSTGTAGRTLDANCTMHKERITQKRKLSLAWRMLDESDISAILTMFNPEYIYVRYWDAMDGRWEVRLFYVGDRSAPLKWFKTWTGTRYEELSFDIIEV
ncbi:MAG: hypothetical protein PUF11_09400 [Parafannyhessea umbonata]|uniref:DUF6711 family protein n=1 Tax=Parafannyhessea umbonata TaxID=604330 RepID=UPI0026EF4DE9|nr:DUF6711 family protein [Parafannyhessea umbonata]MDD6566980.1 hypothetical protein [Parafannyhessea umbonata]